MLDGERALVTGGSRGIGRAVAERLAADGARVALTYATSEADAAEVVAAIEDAGGTACALQMDVRERESVDAAVAEAQERLGGLDVVVNNAGITRDTLLVRMQDAQWDEVLETNLRGIFYVCRTVVRPMMRQRRGKIINMASVAGLFGNAGQTNYSAAKAGILGFTRSLAKEVASRNITVNAVAPGFIETDLTRELPEAYRDELAELIPLGRFGQPEDVAGVVAFLASSAADYMTGTTVIVDGGLAN